MIFRVNVLCLAGAVLGLLAIATPWVTADDMTISEGIMIQWVESTQDNSRLMGIGGVAFLAGVALAFTTNLGGIAQGAGMILTALGGYVIGDPFGYFEYPMPNGPGLGIYLAIVSSALVLVSLAWPVYLGTKRPAEQEDPRFVLWHVRVGRRATEESKKG